MLGDSVTEHPTKRICKHLQSQAKWRMRRTWAKLRVCNEISEQNHQHDRDKIYIQYMVLISTPSWTFNGDTTVFASKRVTNTRLCSKHVMDSSSWLSCFLGLTNSLATFQMMMNHIFCTLIAKHELLGTSVHSSSTFSPFPLVIPFFHAFCDWRNQESDFCMSSRVICICAKMKDTVKFSLLCTKDQEWLLDDDLQLWAPGFERSGLNGRVNDHLVVVSGGSMKSRSQCFGGWSGDESISEPFSRLHRQKSLDPLAEFVQSALG